jgi:hypothetical protein
MSRFDFHGGFSTDFCQVRGTRWLKSFVSAVPTFRNSEIPSGGDKKNFV